MATAAARAEFTKTNARAPTTAAGGGHEQQAIRSSSWHSPVPYLFGGLAAMLGLIAFALLILACSYWKLSGYLDNNGGGNEGDLEAGDGGGGRGEGGNEKQGGGVEYEEKILVIMAGDVKPTYLATPSSMSSSSSGSSSRTSSFGSTNSCSCTGNTTSGLDLVKEGSGSLEPYPPHSSSQNQTQNQNQDENQHPTL